MKKRRLSGSQFIALGFALAILFGMLLLLLPISSKSGNWGNPLNCLFTSTSATCVTGLVVYDTQTHWSIFGQIVILFLIQIGGIGFMTLISMLTVFLRKKINLHERKVIMQASGSLEISGVVDLIKNVCIGTFICEGIGAIILSFVFIPDMGFGRGLYSAIFHSISAFCNAGFDIMGNFASLTNYAGNLVVNITIMLLIIIGGLGFLVWTDLISCKFHYKKLLLHTKIVIWASLGLIFIPAFLFLIFEYNNAFKDLNGPTKVLAAVFQSVTTRTAGFSTVDLSGISDSGAVLTTCLMVIGGSPGSTAGGIKTTTFVVLLFSIFNSSNKTTNMSIGKKEIDSSTTKQALAIVSLYIFLLIAASIMVLYFEPYGIKEVAFECASAIGTVGLSLNITPTLTVGSKIILIILMYTGRMGAMSIIFIFQRKSNNDALRRPTEKILIG